MKNSIFWDAALCSPVKVKIPFGKTYRLHLQGRRVSQARNQHEVNSKQISSCCHLAYYSTLKMEAICSSETLVDFHRITQHWISRDRNLRSHCWENLNSKLHVCPSVIILNLHVIIQSDKPIKSEFKWTCFISGNNRFVEISGTDGDDYEYCCLLEMWRHVVLQMFTNVSKDHSASILSLLSSRWSHQVPL
jgi:hypothetical protein